MAGRQDVTDRAEPAVSVDALMRRLEGDLRNQLRRQLLDRGGAREYTDEELFAVVEQVLRHAGEARGHPGLLLPPLIGDEKEWEVPTHPRFSIHRPSLGHWTRFLN